VGKSPSRFDFKKLENLNGHYIREADDERLADLVAERLGLSAEQKLLLMKAMPELKPRANTLIQLADGARFLFAARPLDVDESAAALLTEDARSLLAAAHKSLVALAKWDAESLDAGIREVAESSGVKLGKLAQPLRAALTGRTTSPGIFDVLALLGREESLARIADQMEPNE
jgi:glutamyl-tRNA synthetase